MAVYLVIGSGGHGANTAGKQTPFIESLGRVVHEHEFNSPVFDIMAEDLRRHGVDVYDDSAGDYDAPLTSRTNMANSKYKEYIAKYGKDSVKCVYVSIHFNAIDGKFDGHDPSGFSVHIQPGELKNESGKLAQILLDQLKEGTKQISRGIVEQDLHVTRETIMPAILSENGFMDNEEEALMMLDKSFQQEVGIEHSKAILKYFGIPYECEGADERVFNDVPKGHWAEEDILLVKEAGLMVGNPDGTFGLGKPLLREEAASILANQIRKGGGNNG